MWILILVSYLHFSTGNCQSGTTQDSDVHTSTLHDAPTTESYMEGTTTDLYMAITTETTEEMEGNPMMRLPLANLTRFMKAINVTGLSAEECVRKLRPYMFSPQATEVITCICFNFACPNSTLEDNEEALLKLKQKKDTEETNDDIAIATTYTLVMFVGIVGNVLVLVTIFKVFKAPTVTNLFISSLSLADLLVLIICIPFRVIDYVGAQVWTLGVETCKFFNYLFFSSFMCSVFILTAMSMERYLVICHPMKAASMSTTSRARKIIVATWILGFTMSIPIIFISGITNYECDVTSQEEVRWKGPFFLYLLFVLYLVPCITMGYAYGRTALALLRSIKTANSLTSGSKEGRKESSDAKARLQVIKMLALVWILFAITWGCYLGYNTIEAYKSELQSVMYYNGFAGTITNQITSLLCMANSAINPILYAFMSSQFRKGFLRCLGCIPIIKRKYLQPTTVSNVTSSTGVYSAQAPAVKS